MIKEKHYVGEVGTAILLACGRDVTNATVKKITCKRPDGSIMEWPAEVYNGNSLMYKTVAGDFNVQGDYEVQSYVAIPGEFEGYGRTAMFVIYERFS